MLFANTDWVGMATFVTAIGGVIGLLIKAVADARAQHAAALRDRKADVKTDQVRQDLIEHNEKASAKQDTIIEKVDDIHEATNSMKDALVAATEKEALIRGASEERKREEQRQADKAGLPPPEPFRASDTGPSGLPGA